MGKEIRGGEKRVLLFVHIVSTQSHMDCECSRIGWEIAESLRHTDENFRA